MQRIKCIFSYDGSGFSGSQVQPNKRTVQSEFQAVLTKMHKGKTVQLYSSGRTDSGVHAKGQVAHFDTDLTMPVVNWQKALNAQLPDDIYVHDVALVPADFHAQFDAIEKEYRYFVNNQEARDVFRRKYSYHYPFDLDRDKIKAACRLFEGTHDFTTFCSAKSTVKGSKVRTLYEVDLDVLDDELVFILRGDGFLYNMVRIIVGVLLDVGSGRTTEADILEMFAQKDRTFAGKTVPAEGLFLWQVKYEES